MNFNKKGHPIAYIRDGDKTKTVYLDDNRIPETDVLDDNINSLIYKKCPFCERELYGGRNLRNHIYTYHPFEQIPMDDKKKKKDIGRNLEVKEGEMHILPIDNYREVHYIAGPAGAGKTSWARNFIKEFNKLHPKRPVNLFSRIVDDKSLEGAKKVQQIALTEELLKDPISLDELKGSLCLFDDIDNSENKNIEEYLKSLLKELMVHGRSHTGNKKDDITVLATGHRICDGTSTVWLLNESTAVTVFPKSGADHQIKRMLKHYIGIGDKEINKILNLPSRWVTIFKRAPMRIVHSRGAYLL